jgi:hypothetical protein
MQGVCRLPLGEHLRPADSWKVVASGRMNSTINALAWSGGIGCARCPMRGGNTRRLHREYLVNIV